jgi:hypothetical protein
MASAIASKPSKVEVGKIGSYNPNNGVLKTTENAAIFTHEYGHFIDFVANQKLENDKFTPYSYTSGLHLTLSDDAKNAARLLAEKNFSGAAESYRQLAKETLSPDLRMRYHLGEGIASLRGKSFKSARTAFSQSLKSKKPDILAEAHLGMANSLFQLGWLELAGSAYPQDPKSSPDMAQFEQVVSTRLKKLFEEEEDGEVEKIEALITNWTDAIRHYDSAVAHSKNNTAAKNNRHMTLAYLMRLRELLEEEKETTQKSCPMPQPGAVSVIFTSSTCPPVAVDSTLRS